MHTPRKIIGSLALSLCLALPAYAQDAQSAIDRSAAAYSVDKIKNAKTIRLESDHRLPFESHDYSSDFHELAQQRFHTVLDIENQSGSNEYLTEISGTAYHGRHFIKDGKAISIAYGPDTYQDDGEAVFYTQFGSTFRGSDVLLALWLSRPDANARHNREAMWLGHLHDVVEIDFPNSPPLQVFVRRADGAITKMDRKISDEMTVYYTFNNHEKSGGILIAREHSFYIEDERIYYSFNRDIDINDRKDRRAFEIDKGITLEPERIDQSEMTVRSVGRSEDPSQLVHQVGQGENCTAFIVSGGSIIGYGMSAGFQERLEAYRKETGITLPLKYVIAADHHDEHIGGASEAADAGAALLVSEHTAKVLRTASPKYALEIIKSAKNISGLRVIPLATDHAATSLVAYHTDQKLLMQTGHNYSSFVDGPSYARRTAVSLYEALPSDIKSNAVAILSGQDMKPETWPDFMSALEKHDNIRCHRDRPICK